MFFSKLQGSNPIFAWDETDLLMSTLFWIFCRHSRPGSLLEPSGINGINEMMNLFNLGFAKTMFCSGLQPVFGKVRSAGVVLLSCTCGVLSVDAAVPYQGHPNATEETTVSTLPNIRELNAWTIGEPQGIEIEFDLSSGAPKVSASEFSKLKEHASSHVDELVVIEFKGAPLRFHGMPSKMKTSLKERSGPSVVSKYNRYMAQQIDDLLSEVRKAVPNANVTVRGIPFEGYATGAEKANQDYVSVIRNLKTFVSSGSIMVGRSSHEISLVVRAFPEALKGAGDRPLVYRANNEWRMIWPDGDGVLEDVVVQDDIEFGETVGNSSRERIAQSSSGNMVQSSVGGGGPSIDSMGGSGGSDFSSGGSTGLSVGSQGESGSGNSSGRARLTERRQGANRLAKESLRRGGVDRQETCIRTPRKEGAARK